MVQIEEAEIDDVIVEEVQQSDERLLDALAIENAAATITRPTAKMHLEGLAKKLRKESEALKRVEASRAKILESGTSAAVIPTLAPVSPVPTPPKSVVTVAPIMPSAKFQPVDRFSFDPGKYNAPLVTVYVPLPSVGELDKELISCDFTSGSFDLVVKDLKGKSFRLFKDSLSHSIDPEKSKYSVKADKIIVKLAKIKGDYGFDSWSELSNTKKKPKSKGKEDPQQGIMDMMKDMYDNGDDQMKKIIGETMLKQRNGEMGKGGGMGDMGDMGM
jgi:calcyclin binding protein